MDRNKLYSILLTACLAGYIWLFYNIKSNLTEETSVEVCLVKYVANIPCPSCGSTRSVISLLQGKFAEAFELNPMGYLAAVVMLATPVWIVTDLLMSNDSLFRFYQQIENGLKKPKYAIPLILLVVINWIWNISKGL
jgi:hypothetical protein